jgi:hypothetical protein
VTSSAMIDPTGRYRYSLARSWAIDGEPDTVVWVMLNPSTADAELDDPTIRKCIGFSRLWGYTALEVVNLFAWRATDPRELRKVSDPVGPGNLAAIAHAVSGAGLVVAAWGTDGWWLGQHGIVLDELRRLGDVYHLGLTKEGFPKHPLYLPYETRRWRWDS